MKLSEAIRVAEKAKSWLDRFPEYQVAVDELINLARTQSGEPAPAARRPREGGLFDRIAGETRKAWDEFTESVFDLPPCTDDAAPAPEVGQTITVNDVVNNRTGTGTLVALSPHGVNVVTVDSWDDTPPPVPAAPKPGDQVPDIEAASNLPEGTLIKSNQTGARGLTAVRTGGTTVVWTMRGEPGEPRYPATIVDVNVP